MEPITTETIGKNVIKIYQDTDAESPREWDNLSTFAFFHRRYSTWNESDIDTKDFASLEEIKKYLEGELKAVCVPVYIYSHSGDTVRTTPFSCPWDSGQLGYAFIEREKALKEYGWKILTQERKEKLESIIEGEVETFDQWLRNDVYGYVIEDENGEHVDSCWGFYGEEDCLAEAKSCI